jgi:hypothetical protein
MRRATLAIMLAVAASSSWCAPDIARAGRGRTGDRAAITAATAGVVDVALDHGAPLRLLHVRVVLTNRHPTLPWRFDPATTWIDLDGTITHPVLVNTSCQTLPIVMVEPGARVDVDAFAPVPSGMSAAGARWILHATVVTPDHRRELTAPIAPIPAFVLGALQPDWWADPGHAWTTFRRDGGVVATLPPEYATVRFSP